MSVSKLLLSCLREGDFAHPGEIEAIQLAMAPIVKNKDQWLLDVGCGLGGTVDYLQRQGYGKVFGIDLDEEVLTHAKSHYPANRFQLADATRPEELVFDQKFKVIYFFSSFFCMPKQQACLANMYQLAEEQADLLIFDYSLLQKEEIPNPFPWSKTVKHCEPIYLPQLADKLSATGWKLKSTLDLSAQFQLWYQQLLQKFREKQSLLEEKFGATQVQRMYQGYTHLLDLMLAKKMGGIVVHATKQS